MVETFDDLVVVALVAVLGVLEHISEGRADAGVGVVVRRIISKIRVGKGGQMVGCAQLRHAIGNRRGEWCARVRRKLSGLRSRSAAGGSVVSAQFDTPGYTVREGAKPVGAGSLKTRYRGI